MNIHILELRKRIIYCIFYIFINFFILFYYSDILYDIFSIPIKEQLPKGSSIVAINITSTFLIPLKLSINLTLILSFPYILLNFWFFVSPGLYSYEKKKFIQFILLSCFLFFLGIFFAFFIICPFALNFFLNYAPSNVSAMISINNYLDFMFTIILISGICFNIPILINIIIKFNIVKKETFKNNRSYIIVFSFILGMFLTPPDVISQILLAIPIILLFELGVFFSK